MYFMINALFNSVLPPPVIDLHCHILPGIDDGAPALPVSLEMARASAANGVSTLACTPHILPGLYHNTGPQITLAVQHLQQAIDDAGIPLRLVAGADNHVTAGFAAGLRSGRLLPLAGSRYVLVEPPHHTPPPRLEEFFFDLVTAGYVPVLTHPERLTWIRPHYAAIKRLVHSGCWMQITAGSLTGAFGRSARYWAERMLDEGLVHILATDAHNMDRRPPNLMEGCVCAEKRVGAVEARAMTLIRPQGILANQLPSRLPAPRASGAGLGDENDTAHPVAKQGREMVGREMDWDSDRHGARGGGRGLSGWLWSLFR